MKDVVVPDGVELQWISAEQSNSSVIVGDIAIIKMFRRVTDGPHPEAEMGRHLTEQGFTATPALLGEVVRIDPSGVRHALGIAQAFVRNQGDAWTWTLDLLLRGLSDLTGGDEAARADASDHADYVRFAGLLGTRLGEMHRVLARPSDDPAFTPRIAGDDDAAALAARVGAQLDDAYRAVAAAAEPEDGAADDYRTMLAVRDTLSVRLPELARAVRGCALTRIHGDLHLGQVLVVNGDVAIIDFEGEPAKPVEARRAKDHPLRDLAGVIRSFAYAAAVVRRRSQASHAHLPDDLVRAFLDSFVVRATDAFTAGYRDAIASNEAEAPSAHTELLDLFLIEKAAYEVVYESANRPGWIDVPLHGLAARTRHLLGAAAIPESAT
jgi:maltose alpha-D-glucosyltransferase/alpha-amylase